MIGVVRRQDEDGLGEVELAGDLLHRPVRQGRGVREHGELVPGERTVGEDVGGVESMLHVWALRCARCAVCSVARLPLRSEPVEANVGWRGRSGKAGRTSCDWPRRVASERETDCTLRLL